MKKELRLRSKIIFLASIVLLLLSLTACSSLSRAGKDISSDFGGGLDRTVTVYNYNGEVIATYTGTIDIEEGEGGKIKFDLDGKRTIIYGGIVIAQEN